MLMVSSISLYRYLYSLLCSTCLYHQVADGFLTSSTINPLFHPRLRSHSRDNDVLAETESILEEEESINNHTRRIDDLNYGTGNETGTEDDGWDLRTDWELQDSVHKYTVVTKATSSKSLCVTFWTKLRHLSPQLSIHTEEDLEQRYKVLQQRQRREQLHHREQYDDSKSSTNAYIFNLMKQSGPSPVLLSDWWISSPSLAQSVDGSSTTIMGGTLESGSRIWFPLEHVGTVGDQAPHLSLPITASTGKGINNDAFRDFFTLSSIALHTSSYAQSIGGTVYELGTPISQQLIITKSDEMKNIETGINDGSSNQDKIIPSASSNHMKQLAKEISLVILSIVAASTVSACVTLGYLNTIKYTTTAVHNGSEQQTVQSPSIKSSSLSASQCVTVTSNQCAIGIDLTIGEQRARQELKVGADKRNILILQDRLERDERKLTELSREEAKLEAKEWGF